MSIRKSSAALAAVTLAMGVTGVAAAKSLYVIASHDGTYSAYNINPGGTVTWQANYPSGAWGPAGMALHDDSETLFVTYEFSGNVVIVDAGTMQGLGTVVAPGASDLAGIDVDDENDVVYAVDRWTDNLYAYDWDPDAVTLTLKSDFPRDLEGCTAPRGAFGIAVDDIADRLYMTCSEGHWSGGPGSGSVLVYDMADWSLIDSFDPVIPPVGIAVDRIRGCVYTTAPTTGCADAPSGYTMLSRYELATGVETHYDMYHGGMGLAVDEVTGYLYVTGGCDGDDLSVWDTTTFTMIQTTGHIGSPAGLTLGQVGFNPYNLTKDDGLEDCAIPGWLINYEICFDNLDNDFDGTNVTILDNLPAQVVYVSSTGTYDPVDHTVFWDIGDLPAGTDRTCLTLTVTLDPSVEPDTTFINFVTIDSDQTPPTTVEWETEVCPMIPVPFDIKPMSCRNPLQVSGGGVLPAAILGTEDFDVTQIDPASLRLEGVPPMRWELEDVETPYEPFLGKEDAFECHAIGPDGFDDLTLKFKKRAVVDALGEVEHEDVLTLSIIGNLLPEYGGTPIMGEDVVVIIFTQMSSSMTSGNASF